MSGAGAMIAAAGRKPAAAGAGGTVASVHGALQDPCSPEVTLLRILYPTPAACGGLQRHMPVLPAPAAAAPAMSVGACGRPGREL